jgi:hypothetical protein
MGQITQFIVDNRLGDWASVLGIVITVVGFIATLINVARSKNAAEQAQLAVDRVRHDMKKMDTVSEIAAVLTTMEEIKRLHRKGEWEILPERYSALRKSLITIRCSTSNLTDDQQTTLQSAIGQFAALEKHVEELNIPNGDKPDVPKLNGIVSRQIDRLHETFTEIKNQIGR